MKFLINNNIYIILLFAYVQITADNKAIIIVPVADLVGAPILTFGLAKTIKESYETMAICGGPNHSSLGAPRIHQALFNEEVEIISIEEGKNGDDGEACIKLESSYFITINSHKPQNLYWTRTKNLISFNKLGKKGISLENIPPTPSFKHPHNFSDKNIIILTQPFHDAGTGQTFSAGTRFIFNPNQSNDTHFSAQIFDRFFTTFRSTLIPKKYAVIIKPQSIQEAIHCFVALLKRWAHCPNGIIEYVWGGSSYTGCCSDAAFELVNKIIKSGKKINVYARNDCKKIPFCGFDCAGLILRAAQICGIPYFYKNSYTLAHHLKSIAIDEHVHEGDLIWIPGHVMIISDIAHNKLIEARGYPHGYGIVHEIELSKVFKGIHTYAQLIHAFHMQQPLVRYNKDGQAVEDIAKFKLLKLQSVWH